MRVTNTMMTNNQLEAVQKSTQRLADLQEKVATGKKFLRPADAPTEMRAALAVQISIAKESRHLATIASSQSFLEEAQAGLSDLANSLNNIHDIAITGAHGSLTQGDRNNLAGEVNQTLEHLGQLANSRVLGEYLFAGTATAQPPFVFARDGQNQIVAAQYQGNAENKHLAIGTNETVAVTIPGDQAFATGLAAVIKLRDLLQNQSNLPEIEQLQAISSSLADLASASDEVLTNLAGIGSRLAYLEDQELAHADTKLAAQDRAAAIEDLDFPSGVAELAAGENAYQAALYLAARSPKGILDFMT